MLNRFLKAVLSLVEETQDFRPVAYRVTLGVSKVTVTHVPTGKSVKFNLI